MKCYKGETIKGWAAVVNMPLGEALAKVIMYGAKHDIEDWVAGKFDIEKDNYRVLPVSIRISPRQERKTSTTNDKGGK